LAPTNPKPPVGGGGKHREFMLETIFLDNK